MCDFNKTDSENVNISVNKGDSVRSDPRDLVARIRTNDQAALGELIIQFKPLMHSLINVYRDSLTAEDLEEMYVEALLGLYDSAMSYDGEQDDVGFGLYAKICIKNRLATACRSYLRRSKLKIVQLGSDEDGEENGAILPSDDGSDPVQTIIERESLEALHKIISDTLSDYENRIWWLYMSGLSAKEVAAVIAKDTEEPVDDKAERSVENAIYRIRRKLRRVLSDNG